MSMFVGELDRLDFRTRLGLAFIVLAAFLSAISVTYVLVYIASCIIKLGKRRWSTQTEIHYYFLNLMICDLVQALGSLLHIEWILIGGIQEGPFCSAQGVIRQLGQVGVALTSLAIGVHTLCVLAFGWKTPRHVVFLVIFTIWLFIILAVSLPFGTHTGLTEYEGVYYPYYGNTKTWCWITKPFQNKEGIALQYVWMWLAMVVNTIIYLFLVLLFRGWVPLDGTERTSWGTREGRVARGRSITEKETIARRLLYYPVVYIITVLPHSIARWLSFSDRAVPLAVTIFAALLFSLNGFLNVVLFAFTRPGLFPGQQVEMAPMTFSKTSAQMQPSERGNASDFDPNDEEGAISSRDIKVTPRDAFTDGKTSAQLRGDKDSSALDLQSKYGIGVALGISLTEKEVLDRRLESERSRESDCSSDYGEGPGPRTRGFV